MISIKDLNPHLLTAEYAVRGPIVIRAQELEKSGKKIIYCNIGQSAGVETKTAYIHKTGIMLIGIPCPART